MTALRLNYTQQASNSAYSKSVTTPFTIPAVGESTTQEFSDVAWLSVGQVVYFADGVSSGLFTVKAINVTLLTLTLENTWDEVTGTTINVGGQVSPGGRPGLSLQAELFATAAQGAKADTALQPTDNISELTNDAGYITLAEVPPGGVTSVDSRTGDVTLTDLYATTVQGALADTALQPGNIGVTVQGYSANTVIDANYVATENSYTTTEKNKLAGIESGATADQTGAEIKALYEAEADTNAYTDAEKTKLAGIASGAEVNVQSDWDATSGDAQILNKPTVYTTTNSATPPAGAIEGDTWWDSETGTTFVYYNDGDTGQWVQSGIINDLVQVPEGASIVLYLSSLDVDISPTTKAAIIPYFPYGVKVEELILQVDTAPTGSNIEADININGTSFLTTVISIDATEKSSKDATTPYVIDTATFPNALIEEGVELTVDIDLVGATVPGQNLVLVIKGVVQE